MLNPRTDKAKGVLNTKAYAKHIWHNRFFPSAELAPFVEHYWIVKWDFSNQPPNTQEILAHPSVHLVFEKGSTRIWGVQTGKFVRVLKDKGMVFGVKFHPGGFFPFYQNPVAGFTDQLLPFKNVFPESTHKLENEILAPEEDATMIEKTEQFLLRYLPEKDNQVEKLKAIIDKIKTDPSILTVDKLIEIYPYSKRTLQRLFRQYVGVSPKWVIQRYRLHEAADKIANDASKNWAGIAHELGYYDQAHFIRDFKKIVGTTPEDFVRGIGNS